MGILAAIGAFNTVTSFASAATGALDAKDPIDFVKGLVGLGSGPSIHTLNKDVMAQIDVVQDFQAFVALNQATHSAHVALFQLLDHDAAPDETLKSSIIENATEGLTAALAMAETILLPENDASPAAVTAAFAAVTTAFQTRIAVVEMLQDGAFARDAIAAELEVAASFLDGAADAMRDSLDVQVSVKQGDMTWIDSLFNPWAAKYDTEWNFSLNSDAVEMSDYAYVWENAFLSDKPDTADPETYVDESGETVTVTKVIVSTELIEADDGDNVLEIGDDVDTLWIREGVSKLLPHLSDDKTFDMSDAGDRDLLALWLEKRLEAEILDRAGMGREGRTLDELSATIRGMLDGEQILGTATADMLSYEDGEDGIDGADFINGKAGDDTIDGGAGDDVLRGELGADVLNGGEGADVLYGGTLNPRDPHPTDTDGYADTFVFEDIEAVDTVHNFGAGEDTLALSMDDFGALGTSVEPGEFFQGARAEADGAKLILDGDALFYDANGGHAGDAIHFATIVNASADIDHADFALF